MRFNLNFVCKNNFEIGFGKIIIMPIIVPDLKADHFIFNSAQMTDQVTQIYP